jgi:hypothetical protein
MRKLMLVAVFLSSVAFAQTEKKKVESKQLPKTQTLIFGDGSEIDGEAEKPNIEIINARKAGVFPSMIRIRDNFNDKLIESVHEL